MSSSLSLQLILEKISHIALQIQQGRALESILQEAIAGVKTLLHGDRILVYCLEPNQTIVVAFESIGTGWQSLLGQRFSQPCLETSWIEKYRQGHHRSVADLQTGQPPCHVELVTGLKVQGNLILPILNRQELWGLLVVHCYRQPRSWHPVEMQYLEQIALHLSIAIQQAELPHYDPHLSAEPCTDQLLEHAPAAATDIDILNPITQQKSPDAALQAQRERACSEVIQVIRSSLELDSIFAISAKQIAEFLDGEVSIVKYLPEQRCWRHLVAYNREAEQPEKLATDIPDAGNPFAAQLKRLQWVQIDNTDTIDDPINQELAQSFPGAWLLMPISVNGTIWGSLSLGRLHQTLPWQPDDIDLAERVADQLAIAIQQAALYQQIQASEEKLSNVLDNIDASVTQFRMFANRDWEYDYISSGCHAIFGFSPQDFYQDKTLWLSQIFSEDRAKVTDGIFDAILSASTHHLEYRFCHRDGSIRWISETLTSQWRELQQCWVVTLVSTDISERKQAEIALKASEQRLSVLISNLPGYVYRVQNDPEYTPDFISQGVTAITGYHPDEYLVERSITCGQEIDADDAVRVWNTVQQALKNHTAYQCEYRITTKTGQQKWVWERGQGTYSEAGELLWLEGFVTDISDRKRSEAERKQKEDLIQNIAQGVSAKTGKAFFHSLVDYLIRLLEVDQAFISEIISPDNTHIRIIAGLSNGQVLEGLEFALAGSPCEQVVAQGVCLYLDHVQQQFPNSPALAMFEAEDYVGIPLVHSSGNVIGVIGVLSNQAIANVQFVQEVLTIFAVRAASELERQQSEVLLRCYERIVSATPDCVSLVDRNYIYKVINQTYLVWNEKSYDEIVGHSIGDLLGQEFFETRIKALIDRCLAGETEHSFEAWQTYSNGKRRYVRATYAPYVEEDGSISGVVIHVHDLTALKNTEEALQRKTAELDVYFASALDLLCIANFDGYFVRLNPQWEKVLGYSLDELQSQPFLDFVHPDDLQATRDTLTLLSTKQEIHNFINRYRAKDGSYRWIEWRSLPRGSMIYAVARDVSDRKAAEAALLTSQQQYQNLVENSPDIIERFDVNLRHLYVSPVLTEITGIATETFLGKTCRDLGMDEGMIQRWETAAAALMATGQKQVIEFDTPTLRGIRSFEMAIAPEFSAQQTIESILCISRDVTERKASEAALRQQQQFIEKIAESTLAILYIYDLSKRRNTYINAQVETILGYSPSEIEAMGHSWFSSLLHPNDLSKLSTNHQRWLVLADSEIVETSYRMQHKNGGYRWLLSRDRVLSRTADGKPQEILGIAVDITVLKQAQTALNQQAEREHLLKVITQNIRQTLDLDQILQTTVTEVRHFLQTDRVIIYRLAPDQSGVIIAESVGAGWNSILGIHIPNVYVLETQRQTYQQGWIQGTNDIYTANLSAAHLAVFESMQVRAKLVVPILQNDRPWGLLVAQQCRSPRRWKALEIELQQQLATQIAIALQQANLYQKSQLELAERQRAETALQQLNQQLEQRVHERTQTLQQQAEQERLLRLIVQNIHHSLDLQEVLTTVLNETRQTLKADRVAVYQFYPDWSGTFIEESVADAWVPLVNTEVYPVWRDTYLQETQGGRYQHNEPFAVDDIYAVGHSQCHIDLLEQFQARAYAIAPIFLGDKLWGLLATYQNSGPRAWQDWEIHLLQQIAVQTAIALRQSHLYQASQTQIAELEQLHQLKDDFLSTVSHELRSPMSNIKLATQMLEICLEPLGVFDDETTPISRYFKVLREEGQREINLINDLLDLARLDAGTDSLQLTTIPLQDYIPHIAEPFIERTQNQQQQLIFAISDDLPPITTDLSYLERILTELLHNACKYTPADETITVSVQSAGKALTIQVSNTGVEIPTAELERVFEKFYRVPNGDPWKHGGTGLGLALVKKLVERLGGTIQVNSFCNQTTFTITLEALPEFPAVIA